MRKPFLPILLAVAVAGPWAIAAKAHGDGDGPRGPRMEFMLDHLLDTVNATDAQRTQIEAIADKYKPQMKALHDQMHALHKQMHTEIDGVLTDEQKQKLESEKAKFHHRHHDAPPSDD